MTISDDIRAGRDRIGLTQKQLAEALGVAERTVIRWEMGTGEPSAAARDQLEDLLGVKLRRTGPEGAPTNPIERLQAEVDRCRVLLEEVLRRLPQREPQHPDR